MPVHFKTKLAEQLGFLGRSCEDFDPGHHAEAVRIAAVLRTLFHDTRSSTSLLSHLNARKIHLLSTTFDIMAMMRERWTIRFRLLKFNGLGICAGFDPYLSSKTWKFANSTTPAGTRLVERGSLRFGQ
jgi:hypothetical protein